MKTTPNTKWLIAALVAAVAFWLCVDSVDVRVTPESATAAATPRIIEPDYSTGFITTFTLTMNEPEPNADRVILAGDGYNWIEYQGRIRVDLGDKWTTATITILDGLTSWTLVDGRVRP